MPSVGLRVQGGRTAAVGVYRGEGLHYRGRGGPQPWLLVYSPEVGNLKVGWCARNPSTISWVGQGLQNVCRYLPRQTRERNVMWLMT